MLKYYFMKLIIQTCCPYQTLLNKWSIRALAIFTVNQEHIIIITTTTMTNEEFNWQKNPYAFLPERLHSSHCQYFNMCPIYVFPHIKKWPRLELKMSDSMQFFSHESSGTDLGYIQLRCECTIALEYITVKSACFQIICFGKCLNWTDDSCTENTRNVL